MDVPVPIIHSYSKNFVQLGFDQMKVIFKSWELNTSPAYLISFLIGYSSCILSMHLGYAYCFNNKNFILKKLSPRD